MTEPSRRVAKEPVARRRNRQGGRMTYQYTRREAGMTAESVVGPLRTFEEARSAVVEDLVSRRRPRLSRRRATKLVAQLSPSAPLYVPLHPARPLYSEMVTYSIEPRLEPDPDDPDPCPEDAEEETRRQDATNRHRTGVALVHLDALLTTMGQRVPEHLRGEARDAYVEALCDIPIHVQDATVEHDTTTGALDWKPTPVRPNVAQALGNRWDRTGAWKEA